MNELLYLAKLMKSLKREFLHIGGILFSIVNTHDDEDENPFNRIILHSQRDNVFEFLNDTVFLTVEDFAIPIILFHKESETIRKQHKIKPAKFTYDIRPFNISKIDGTRKIGIEITGSGENSDGKVIEMCRVLHLSCDPLRLDEYQEAIDRHIGIYNHGKHEVVEFELDDSNIVSLDSGIFEEYTVIAFGKKLSLPLTNHMLIGTKRDYLKIRLRETVADELFQYCVETRADNFIIMQTTYLTHCSN